MDFDDLIRLPVDLFNQFPDALLRWQQRLRYILVDDTGYQRLPVPLMKLLAGRALH